MVRMHISQLFGVEEDKIIEHINGFKIFQTSINKINKNDLIPEIGHLIIENCIIERDVILDKASINNRIEFIECTFKENLYAQKANFVFLEFKRCVFEKMVVFDGAIFRYSSFVKSIFNGKSSFLETKYFKTLPEQKISDFSECIFRESVCFDRSYFDTYAYFYSSVFEKEARFIDVIFNALDNEDEEDDKKLCNDFSECSFYGKVNFYFSYFLGRAKFTKSHFYEKSEFIGIQCSSVHVDNLFNETIFYKTSNFDKAMFLGFSDFSNSYFYGEISFNGVVFRTLADFSLAIFQKEAHWYHTSFYSVLFVDTEFIDSSIWKGARFVQKVEFNSVSFGEKTLFSPLNKENPTMFDNEAIFHNTTFEDSDFSRIEFKSKVRFDGVVFKGLTSFYKTNFKDEIKFLGNIFNGITSFDGTIFTSPPTFFKCTFGNQLNIEHQYLKYEFDNLEKMLEDKKESQEEKDPSLWRDLFRRLKSNRLAHHNVIDASELHTQELYARELELRQKGRGIREKIEKWQLWFYRLTSDHHTDLAKIFNNVILLIALFALFSSTLLMIPLNQESSTMRFIQENGGVLSIFDLKTLPPQTKKSFEIGWGMQWFLSSIYCVVFVLAYLGIIRLIEKIDKIENSKKISQGIYGIAYVVAFGFLTLKPALLLPIIGKFFDESIKINLLPMQSLCVVYYVLMILMLFSLQKTARKNSIIPS